MSPSWSTENKVSQNHRIIWVGRDLGRSLIQHPAQRWLDETMLLRAMSSQILNVSKDLLPIVAVRFVRSPVHWIPNKSIAIS